MHHRTVFAALALASAFAPGAHAQCDPSSIFPDSRSSHGTAPSAGAPWRIVTADLNNDGAIDLIDRVNDFSDDFLNRIFRLTITLGNGDGTFQDATIIEVGLFPLSQVPPENLAVGDLNGDTFPDIVLSSASANFSSSVSVLLGNGDGTFQPQQEYDASGELGTNFSQGIDIGDLNGDGLQDIVVSSTQVARLRILEQQPDGSFVFTQALATGSLPGDVKIFDFGNTGRNDIVVANQGSNAVTIYLNAGPDPLGGGGQLFVPGGLPVGSNPTALMTGDLNNDGLPDIVTANSDSDDVSVYVSGGDNGAYLPEVRLSAGDFPNDVCIADLTGDGTPEIVVNHLLSEFVSVYSEDTSDVYTEHRFDSNRGRAFACADLDGDSDIDIAKSVFGSSNDTIFNRCINTPVISMLTEGPIFVDAGMSAELSVTLSDGSLPIYQWRKNGVPLLDNGRVIGATTDTLTILSASIDDTDMYDVVVTNDQGEDTSSTVLLAVRGQLCDGDADGSGTVNFSDLVTTLSLFGPCPE